MAKIDLGRISPTYRGGYDSTVSYNDTNPSIYIRVININPVGIDDMYTSGFGGGGTFNHVSNWVKSN